MSNACRLGPDVQSFQMLYDKAVSLLLSLHVVCVQDIFHEAPLPRSQVSFPIIYLGTNVHIRYLAAYEIANVFTKKAALHFLRSMHSQDVTRWILLVTSRNNRSCFRVHVLLYDRKSSSLLSTDEAKSSFFDPACITQTFQGHGESCWPHIWGQQALVPSISVPSVQDWGWIFLRGEWRLSLHTIVRNYKVEGGTSQVRS